MNKNYYIFTDKDDPQIEILDTYLEDYINENFGEYTLILSETNDSFLVNEEYNRYMVMEYDF